MIKPAIFICITLFHIDLLPAQVINYRSPYTKMDTMSFDTHFSRAVLAISENPESKRYYFSDHEISKEGYRHLLRKQEENDIGKCTPCFGKMYNGDTLLYEGEFYTDCAIGLFRAYHNNGKVKMEGLFKQNPSQVWTSVYPNYCSVEDGLWTHYYYNGTFAYQEMWNNGIFINQYPEQSTTEIWRTLLLLREQPTSDSTWFTADDFANLSIMPLFKNQSRADLNLHFTFELSADKRKVSSTSGSVALLKYIDLDYMIAQGNIMPTDKAHGYLCIYNNSEITRCFSMLIKH